MTAMVWGLAAAGEFSPLLLRVQAERDSVAAGERLMVHWWWANAGEAPGPGDMLVFVHPRLLDREDGTYPMFGGDYQPSQPPWRWLPGWVIEEAHELRVPEDAPAGKYRVMVGVYRRSSGARLRLANRQETTPDGRLPVFELTVLPRDTEAEGRPVDVSLAEPAPMGEWSSARARAQQVLTLRHGRAAVEMDGERGLVLGYQVAGERALDGELQAIEPGAYVCRLADGRRAWTGEDDVALGVRLEKAQQAEALFAVEGRWGDEKAFEARLRATLGGAAAPAQSETLSLRLEAIEEAEGYHLLAYRPGALVSIVGDGKREAHAAWPWIGGRVLYADDARSLVWHGWGSGHGLTAMTVAQWQLAATGNHAAIVEPKPPGVDMLPGMGCGRLPDGRGCIWQTVWLVRRLDAARPEAQLVAYEEPEARVRLVGDEQGDGRVDWQDAARVLWEGVQGGIKPMYLDHLIYKVFCDSPGRRMEDATTFEQALGLIRRVHNLSGGQPAVVYLVGWQYEGHDTGYPAVDKVNERLGGYEALARLIEKAREYGAEVSFHDNYDDAYRDSPQWDEDVMCRDPEGHTMKGGVWAGGQSYIIAHHKYLRPGQGGRERVEYTCARYPVRESYHIDVLSAVPVRHDHDPDDPGNGEANLAAKLEVVELFRRHGLDVTSEYLTWPFVGRMSRFRALAADESESWRPRELLLGEIEAPVVLMALHGKVAYGGHVRDTARAVTYGFSFATDWTRGTQDASITDRVYLCWMPWRALAGRAMTGWEREDDREVVRYEGEETYVEREVGAGRWRVLVDGYEMARDGTVVAVNGDRELLVYGVEGEDLDWVLPRGWRREGEVTVERLTGGGPQTVGPARVVGGSLRMHVAARVPYRVRERVDER